MAVLMLILIYKYRWILHGECTPRWILHGECTPHGYMLMCGANYICGVHILFYRKMLNIMTYYFLSDYPDKIT